MLQNCLEEAHRVDQASAPVSDMLQCLLSLLTAAAEWKSSCIIWALLSIAAACGDSSELASWPREQTHNADTRWPDLEGVFMVNR